MSLDREQKGIIVRSAIAIVATLIVLAAAYLWLPAAMFGLGANMTAGDRIAFALKVNLPVFLWLAWCLRRVSSGRFHVSADRKGAAMTSRRPHSPCGLRSCRTRWNRRFCFPGRA